MKRYALADYLLTISIPTEIASDFGAETITIGGEGSYLDSLTISSSTELFQTKGDATGGWVHVKNLDRSGTITLTIQQVSDDVAKLKRLFNVFYSLSTESDGLTLTIKSSVSNNVVAICNDVVIAKVPDQSFSSDVATQQWTLNAGQIVYMD